MTRRWLIVVGSLAAFGLGACDEDPFQVNWEADADTAQLFALSRPELNLPAAFDFFARLPVRIESPTAGENWDLAVDSQDGTLVWLPPRALGLTTEAGVAVIEDQSFLDLRLAPGDTARYARDRAVPIRVGEVYVVRTRLIPGAFGTVCSYYGKIEALEVEVDPGQLTFQYDVSPVCNDRDLIPPN